MEKKLIHSVRFHSAIATVVYVVFLLGSMLMLHYSEEIDVSFHFMLFLSGALGGITNNYVRIKKMPNNAIINANTTTNQLAIIQVYVSPMVAGVFGFMLYALFLSGLMQGPLFPEFQYLKHPFTTVQFLFQTVHPLTQLDAAKSLIWAFIAGFSEMMVPNILDKIAVDAEKSTNTD